MNGRRLYEEIGGVDERYLQEAAVYRVKRKQAPAWRALLIAAALTLAVALLLCTVAASVTIGAAGIPSRINLPRVALPAAISRSP